MVDIDNDEEYRLCSEALKVCLREMGEALTKLRQNSYKEIINVNVDTRESDSFYWDGENMRNLNFFDK